MSIRVEKYGITYFVEGKTEEEQEVSLRVIQRSLTEPTPEKNGSAKQPTAEKKTLAKEDKRKFESKQKRAIAFLATIQEAGKQGIKSEPLKTKLKLKSTKAIGAESGTTNGLLARVDLDSDEVFSSTKPPNETRTFYPEEKIAEAIKKIKALAV